MGCSSWTSWVDPFHILTTSEEEEAAQKQQQNARNRQASLEQQSLDLQKEMYDRAIGLQSPYMRTGFQGLGQLYGQEVRYTDPVTKKEVVIPATGKGVDLFVDPMTGQRISQPEYEKEVTQRLGQYQESPAYQAQNELAQRDLQRQLAARGLNYGATGASAGAELSQRLRSADYDRYRADLAARYAGLQGEYSQKRQAAADEYGKIMSQANLGLGVAQNVSGLGQTYGSQASNQMNVMGNTGMNYANAQYKQAQQETAQPFQNLLGIGSLGVSALGVGRSGTTNKTMNWWGQ